MSLKVRMTEGEKGGDRYKQREREGHKEDRGRDVHWFISTMVCTAIAELG